MTMNVRAEALARAIADLPECCADSPNTICRDVEEIRPPTVVEVFANIREDAADSVVYQRLVFRKMAYGRYHKRWFEWVLEVA